MGGFIGFVVPAADSGLTLHYDAAVGDDSGVVPI
jgi:hypothetical protein